MTDRNITHPGQLNFEHIKTYPVRERHNLVTIATLATPGVDEVPAWILLPSAPRAAQARAMTREWIRKGKQPAWSADGIPLEQLNVKLLSKYAEKGDADAQEIFRMIGGKLGAAQLGEQLGDYAAVLTACHGLGIRVEARPAAKPETMRHLEHLLERYPDPVPVREAVIAAFFLLTDTFRAGGKLLICGNGGSAADADHIVGELMKGFQKHRPVSEENATRFGAKAGRLQNALPAISLAGHTALSTAFGNDVSPDMVFSQQVFGYGRPGDCLLALSTSGNSTNVVQAAQTAQELGMKTVALTGPSGSLLGSVCDVTIQAPGGCTAEVQERHLPIYHALCAMLEEEFF